MRAFWRAAISEEHANGVGEIILWCHYTGSRGHHTPHLLGNGHRGKVKVWQLDVGRDPPRLVAPMKRAPAFIIAYTSDSSFCH
jgi:hypothetical protein